MSQPTPLSRLGLLLFCIVLLGGCVASETVHNPENPTQGKPRRDAITWESGR